MQEAISKALPEIEGLILADTEVLSYYLENRMALREIFLVSYIPVNAVRG
jgi:hypothetical protein